MRSIVICIASLIVIAPALSVGICGTGAVAPAKDNDQGKKIAILDDCDPTDPGWAPTGGCVRKEGDVNVAEFNALLSSPLSLSTVGHPAWRFGPSYLKIEPGETVRVKNQGGRGHTFTEVAAFGGGRVPPLNIGLTTAPECPGAALVTPGATIEVTGLSVGIHRFQCCIHPWMRALIKVKPEDEDKGDR